MKMIHSMIRVRNLDVSVKFYQDAFNLVVKDRVSFPTFTLVYLSDNQGFELELTWNANNVDPYDLGAGYGHLAFLTDNLENCWSRLEEARLRPQPIKSLSLTDKPFAKFFFLTDPDGYKIEILERVGRFSQ